MYCSFLDPGSQKATVVVVVVISSLKVQKFLSLFNTERSAKICTYIRGDIAHRATVSDFSLIS